MANEGLNLVVYVLEANDQSYEYGIPIHQVHEITRLGNVIKLPGMPDFISGIMNLRGEIIPIIDFKKRFQMGETEAKDTTRIIVVNIDHKKCGVIVDDVLEIVPIADENIEEAPNVTGGVKQDFIIGIGKLGERMIIAIDVVAILTENEQQQIEALGA